MKTNNQVEVIVFKITEQNEILVLMLKRNEKKGGFWQPVTGNVEVDESFEDAAHREVYEELGIKELEELIDTGYSFQFFDDGRNQTEHVFGGRISYDQEVSLSTEHTECKWVVPNEALIRLLKFPGNKEGLRRLCEMLVNR